MNATATAPTHDPYAALRQPGYRRYLWGWIVAQLGQQIQSVAVGWQLFDRTGDDYYLQRTRDAVLYGTGCVCREGEDFGWGKPGWMCERFCPSDGLLIQHDLRTGEPISVGCDYHPWVVAVALEGEEGEALVAAKMSKSKPWTCVFVHDSAEEIGKKIAKAYGISYLRMGNRLLQDPAA